MGCWESLSLNRGGTANIGLNKENWEICMLAEQKKPTIRAFNHFLRTDLKRAVVRSARRHQILSEADLHAFCFFRISRWIRTNDTLRVFRTHNKQYLTESGKYPDIVIFRKDRPWALIELKEQRLLKISVANSEAKKLSEIRDDFGKRLKKMAPRTYVIYVARRQEKESSRVPFVGNCNFIPIVLSEQFGMNKDEYHEWLLRFRTLTKYAGKAHASRPKKNAAAAGQH